MILYTTDCPKCLILEEKLGSKGIEYEKVKDVKLMRSMGLMSAPNLEVDGKVMNFKEANDYINSL